jgi:type VI secretion system protein ImpG
MDPRLLRLYADELAHLQEVGQEFAQAFPQVASRLGMETLPVADPYVERLLEGFAFLAARVQLKLESEQPRLIAQMLEALYPNFLVPVPSMLVARLSIDMLDPNLAHGAVFPRGSALRSEIRRGRDTQCEFTTAHDVTLWPIEIASAGCFAHAPDLPLGRLGQVQGVKGGLRIRLRAGGGLKFSELRVDRLPFYIAAPANVAFRLHELIQGRALGTLVGTDAGLAPLQWRGADSIAPLGVDPEQALLPESLRTFSGHRLLQEVAAMPQRLLFFEIRGLAERLARVPDAEVDVVVLFSREDPGLESLVDARSLALFCTPAINLFAKRLDRIQIGPEATEHQLVPDRTRPADFEIHSLQSVTGHGSGDRGPQEFLPLYAPVHAEPPSAPGHFTLRREPRLLSSGEEQRGARSSYVGDEVFIALVDPRHAPYRADIRQLAVKALVTNRDLPILLPQAAADAPRGGRPAAPAWKAVDPGSVLRVDVLHGPTRPLSRRPVGDLGWRLVSHLGLNHLSLVGESPERAAAVLRSTLALYGPPDDVAWQRQVDGLRSLRARTVVRRLPFEGPLTFGTGIDFDLELDELAFQGTGAFLFASVLERFLARHAALNTFTQMRLTTPQRGEVMRWPPRVGSRELA